jgi:hypothetical protein
VPAPPRAAEAGEHDDNPFEAAEYFREQRVLGEGLLPVERYTDAMRHVGTMRRYSPPRRSARGNRWGRGTWADARAGW